jgi:hypothetical protein
MEIGIYYLVLLPKKPSNDGYFGLPQASLLSLLLTGQAPAAISGLLGQLMCKNPLLFQVVPGDNVRGSSGKPRLSPFGPHVNERRLVIVSHGCSSCCPTGPEEPYQGQDLHNRGGSIRSDGAVK